MYVLKRPYVDEFLQRMGELFECVLFTASLAKVSMCLPRPIGPRCPVRVPEPQVMKSTHTPLSCDSCCVSLPS